MPIYMVVEGVKGTIETAETDTLVFKDSSTEASSGLFVGNRRPD